MGRNPFIDDMAGDDDEDDINDYDDLDIAEVVKNDLKKSTGYIASTYYYPVTGTVYLISLHRR
jgi:hypothetical protein